MFYLFLFLSGASVGFLSGLLGLGGGIILFPLLLYVPPHLGFAPIGVKGITGLTMAQGFFASLSAMLYYRRHQLVNTELVLALGLSLFASSLVGSIVSKWAPDGPILFIFGLLALSAAVMMFVPRRDDRDETLAGGVEVNKAAAIPIGLGLGFFLGLVGQGGAFIIIPVLLYILKIPLRVAIGSTLAIGLFSATAGLAGKLATGQVPLPMAAAMLAGAIPFAHLGGRVGKKTDTRHLRWLLALVIGAAAVRIWFEIF